MFRPISFLLILLFSWHTIYAQDETTTEPTSTGNTAQEEKKSVDSGETDSPKKSSKKEIEEKKKKTKQKKAVKAKIPVKKTATKPVLEKTPEPAKLPDSATEKTAPRVWVNEELAITPNHLPGFKGNEPKESGSESLQKKITSLLDEKKREDVKSDNASKSNTSSAKQEPSFWNSFADYKKALIILALVILFALYRMRVSTSKGTRGSPTTINKYRRR